MPDFDFGSKELKNISYIGSGTSHFQAEPVMYGPTGEKHLPVSDWEEDLAKQLNGKKSHLVAMGDQRTFPRFLEKKELYTKRSAELGENMYRISFDFPRLSPMRGEFNGNLMKEYIRTLALIRANGQEPMVTLYHWTMPISLLVKDVQGEISKGGWEHPRALEHFRFYVQSVMRHLSDKEIIKDAIASLDLPQKKKDELLEGDLVRYFKSVNEPVSLLYPTYIRGNFPPYKKWRPDLMLKVLGRLVKAHDIAYEEIKKTNDQWVVGIAHHWVYFDGLFGWVGDFINRYITRRFERDGSHSDFIALQYYFRLTLPLFSRKGRDFGDDPFFGDMYPAGIENILTSVHAMYPKKDIYVTEFGFADAADQKRPFWILESVRYMLRAASKGVPLKGIMLWSMVNNFEWSFGMTQKFGLFTEGALAHEMVPSKNGITSWEAWQALTQAVADPSEGSLRHLRECYGKALAQHEIARHILKG